MELDPLKQILFKIKLWINFGKSFQKAHYLITQPNEGASRMVILSKVENLV